MIEKRLTAEEVAGKRFTPVRLREGYSMDEVDAFLDEVEAALIGQEAEVKELQAQVRTSTASSIPTAPNRGSGAASPDPVALAELADAKLRIAQLEKDLATAKATPAVQSDTAPAGQSIAEASSAVGRMIEMAARQHDDLIEQGRVSSEKIVTDAKAEAQKLLDETHTKIREERERLDGERSKQLAQLEAERAGLEQAIDQLRHIENTSREALGHHFTARLEELKNVMVPPADKKAAPSKSLQKPEPEVVEEEVEAALPGPDAEVHHDVAPESVQPTPEGPEHGPDRGPEAAGELAPEGDEPKKSNNPADDQPHNQQFPSFFDGKPVE